MNQSKLSTVVWQNPVYFLGFGFGLGLMPKAPGTWGTLAAIPLYLLLAPLPWGIYLTLTVAFFMIGISLCSRITRDLGINDYGGIVWDEIVGLLFTLFLAPPQWYWIVVGFLLFRLFDIWKPYPIRLVDMHIKRGIGIMLDDVLAAVPAWLLLQLLAWGCHQ